MKLCSLIEEYRRFGRMLVSQHRAIFLAAYLYDKYLDKERVNSVGIATG
jgi:hypothetical protein